MADCPVCQLYDRCAIAAGLLTDLVDPAMAHGDIPPGLGGVLGQAQRRLIEADRLIHQLAPRLGWDHLAELDALIERAATALNSQLQPSDINLLAAIVTDCRRRAFRVAWTYFAAGAGVR